MKKLIAILATAIAASGVTAFGQDWISFSVANSSIWLNTGTTPAMPAVSAGTVDAVLLFSTTSAADLLSSVGTEFGLRGSGVALDQVATNATSLGGANPQGALATMLGAGGGWNVANDMALGGNTNAAVANDTASGKGGITYNGGAPFQVAGVTLGSGATMEEVVLAYNASAGSWASATALGWSNPFQNSVGTSVGDVFATSTQASANQFGIVTVPEPTTLALAGLGGLATLMLRRRKA
jgi:hypothetical protein